MSLCIVACSGVSMLNLPQRPCVCLSGPDVVPCACLCGHGCTLRMCGSYHEGVVASSLVYVIRWPGGCGGVDADELCHGYQSVHPYFVTRISSRESASRPFQFTNFPPSHQNTGPSARSFTSAPARTWACFRHLYGLHLGGVLAVPMVCFPVYDTLTFMAVYVMLTRW